MKRARPIKFCSENLKYNRCIIDVVQQCKELKNILSFLADTKSIVSEVYCISIKIAPSKILLVYDDEYGLFFSRYNPSRKPRD